MNRVAAALALAAALTACRDRRAVEQHAAEPPSPSPASACAALEYAATIDVPEASGAAWLPADSVLLVVSDSGNQGAYVELDGRGAIVRRGELPLGGAGEDVEGLARVGDRIWGLTSGGWMLAWQRVGDGFLVAVPAFPIDPAAPCAAASVNCGANYEGVCLAPRPLADGCDGYAASKTSGRLVCLVRDGERYRLDPARGFAVAEPAQLADCAIADDGAVWTGDNGFGMAMVRRWVVGADGATLAGAAALGVGFPEVLAFGPDGVVYRLSDLGRAPSLALAYRCGELPKAGPAPAAQ